MKKNQAQIQCAGTKLASAQFDSASMIMAVQELEKNSGASITLFDAKMIFGEAHLHSAALHAIRAYEQGTNTSSSLSTEALLYASGERQINLAISKMGINQDINEICILVIGEQSSIDEIMTKIGLVRYDAALEPDKKMLSEFGLTKAEIESADNPFDIILEKVAMVDIIK